MGFYSSTSKRIPHLIVLFIFWFTQTKTGTLYQRRGTRVRGCAWVNDMVVTLIVASGFETGLSGRSSWEGNSPLFSWQGLPAPLFPVNRSTGTISAHTVVWNVHGVSSSPRFCWVDRWRYEDMFWEAHGKQSEYPRTAKAQWGEALEQTADIRDSALVHPLRAGHFT